MVGGPTVASRQSSDEFLLGHTVTGPASARLTIDGKPYINFYGCGYLALTHVPEIRDAARAALDAGVSFAQHVPAAFGARDPIFEDVECAAAEALGAEASVYFSSGYFIGIVAAASLDPSPDVIVIDELAHYSLNDAATLSGCQVLRFRHADVDSLEEVLHRQLRPGQRPVVFTDGVFATTGTIPPLADYARVLIEFGGRLLIDESHAIGILGAQGRGAAEACNVESLTVRGATLSKAFCAQGAVVACSRDMARKLRKIPAIRGVCAGSPISAAISAASVRYASRNPELRTRLLGLTRSLRERLRAVGLSVSDSPAPIVAFQLPSASDMIELRRRAFERGIHLQYSTYVGAGPNGCIRCAVFADHTESDLDALIDAIR